MYLARESFLVQFNTSFLLTNCKLIVCFGTQCFQFLIEVDFRIIYIFRFKHCVMYLGFYVLVNEGVLISVACLLVSHGSKCQKTMADLYLIHISCYKCFRQVGYVSGCLLYWNMFRIHAMLVLCLDAFSRLKFIDNVGSD